MEQFFKRKKAANGTGRAVRIKHVLVPEDVAEDLNLFKLAYGSYFGISVTFEQMLRRWMDNVGQFDPEILKEYRNISEEQKRNRTRMAEGLGLSLEQMEENERSFDPAEGEVWNLEYFFEKDGEEMVANVGEISPFFGVVDGDMYTLLSEGWFLENESGYELDMIQASRISRLIKQHRG